MHFRDILGRLSGCHECNEEFVWTFEWTLCKQLILSMCLMNVFHWCDWKYGDSQVTRDYQMDFLILHVWRVNYSISLCTFTYSYAICHYCYYLLLMCVNENYYLMTGENDRLTMLCILPTLNALTLFPKQTLFSPQSVNDMNWWSKKDQCNIYCNCT